MASEVDICNLALSHLGDDATVSSINPPEGSAQAEHCARFYPLARDIALESHEWGFATRRANLALLADTPPPGFNFVYQAPNNCRNIIDLIDPVAVTLYPVDERACAANWVGTALPTEPIPYEMETNADGVSVIYTNLENATVRFVASITDTTKFSAQFVDAISWLLAAYLAGPVIKGDAGAAMAKAMMQGFLTSMSLAKTSDANNRRRSVAQSQRQAAWIASR
jgi:hypothetical protein